MQSSVAAPIFGFQIGASLQELLQHLCCAKVGSPVARPLALLRISARLGMAVQFTSVDPLPLYAIDMLGCWQTPTEEQSCYDSLFLHTDDNVLASPHLAAKLITLRRQHMQ